MERERELGMELEMAKYKPLPLKAYSKLYYLWLVAERNRQQQVCPRTAQPIEKIYGTGIPMSTLRNLEQHRELCCSWANLLLPVSLSHKPKVIEFRISF